MLKRLMCILLVMCLVPACTAKLELGTVGVTIAIDEWAQANVLKALDELIAGDREPVPEILDETEVVLP